MKIEITKKQETINDTAKEPLYTVFVERKYGTGDIQWRKTDLLHDFDEEDIKELAKKLADKFLASTPLADSSGKV
jgi:hypothetical protein